MFRQVGGMQVATKEVEHGANEVIVQRLGMYVKDTYTRVPTGDLAATCSLQMGVSDRSCISISSDFCGGAGKNMQAHERMNSQRGKVGGASKVYAGATGKDVPVGR